MNKWIKKTFVAIVTILTFGLVTPYQTTIHATDHGDLDRSPEKDDIDTTEAKEAVVESIEYEYVEPDEPIELEEELSAKEGFVFEAIKMAEKQSFMKFGERIGPVIENEFTEIILPNIEKAIRETAEQFADEELEQLAISEKPGKGLSEKIFHIYDKRTGKDIIRFHVRRELRPKEGYWFNFHYHTYHDDFYSHYPLGDIYWDKNTPPKWMN